MRVLMISKACVVATYRKKVEELCRFPDIELTLIVPPYWRDERGVMPLEQRPAEEYQLIVERMALNGHFHLYFYPGLGRRMKHLRPDIVHIDEEPYNLAAFQAMRLAKRVGARALFFTWQNIHRRYPPPFNWMQHYNFRRADYAIAGNSEAVRVLRGKGYGGPIKVIPQFGVDPDVFRPDREAVDRGGEFVIGYVGRLVEEKGVEILMRAVADLDGSWRLRILGSGPLRTWLEELAQELGISAKVTFDPPIPSSQMPRYLNGLDALVLPSLTRPNWKEQFGRVLIEAMACGVPVIGSDSGQIPHVIGEAGLVFSEGDAQSLLKELQRLMDHPPLRVQLSSRGRERVLAHYTQARIAAETYQVYKELGGGSI